MESTEEMLIVGVGASAGGLEALEKMFVNMPDDCGMAFVVVQHLSPDFKSLMGELLSRHTRMNVRPIEDGTSIEPDTVYMLPPNYDMIASSGRLLLAERDSSQVLALPIDNFFRSLAQDSHRNSVAVVLSGTGSDGSRGISEIHEAGGLVIAQSPETAQFDGMPATAIETQVVDVVVPPEKIGDVLAEYKKHRNREEVAEKNALRPTGIDRVFKALQDRHRINFSQYKPTTIGRRVERRIDMDNTLNSVEQYADRLEKDEDELDRLYRDLLIGVTRFFRDVAPFKFLRESILPDLLRDKATGEEFRVWVAACATGEEALSIAILIDECLREMNLEVKVKIFATDIHEVSIRQATAGVFSPESMEAVSQERRERYFSEVEGGFQVSSHIRKMVVYAQHNLIKDPPFTQLDLVTCRNLLIYLLPQAQKKLLSLFHFGLRIDGILLLGKSETLGDLENEFEKLNERERIFKKKKGARVLPYFNEVANRSREVQSRFRDHGANAFSTIERDRLSFLENLLEHFMPPAFIVSEDKRILQVFQGAGEYLSISDGKVSTNLLELLEDDFRLAVAGAIQRCASTGKDVCYDSIRISDRNESVKLVVRPLKTRIGSNSYIVSLEQVDNLLGGASIADDKMQHLELDEVSKNHLHELEIQLQHTKANLQASVEEMETSNEELNATNEELIASNEELHSTNEELHCVNEELSTINAEYQRKIAELTELTNDFENLLASTEVHTLFLDENLCVRKFTPKMAEVFHLLPQDVGRPINAFVHGISSEGISNKIDQVLKTGVALEENVRDSKDNPFLMRLLPYKASESIDGVVLTLIDISSLVEAQEIIRIEKERFKRAIEANRDGIWDWPDLTKMDMWWSPTCYELLGYEPGGFPPLHSEWLRRIHPADRAKIIETTLPSQDKCYVELHESFEYRMQHRSGQYRWFCHRAIVNYDESGKAVRMSGSIADIHDRKQAKLVAERSIRARDKFLSMLSHELRNPIGAVLNAIESIDAINPIAETAHAEELSVIQRQSHQMSRLLDDLLEVARYGRGQIEFRKEVVDLCRLVDPVIESMNFELRTKNLSLNTSISEGPLLVMGDPARLMQAQVNLLANAAKFSNESEDIEYRLERVDDVAVITITDHGAGIISEDLEDIFELFVQSTAATEQNAAGLGVGLSLVRTIVDAHQGVVAAASEGIDKGSMFQIRIPLTNIDPENTVSHETLPSIDSTDQIRVLVVEDNEDARKMLALALKRKGFVVATAEDGKVALDRFLDFDPNFALIDIGLPKISGIEVARTVRTQMEKKDTVLVALTGYGHSLEEGNIEEAGFDAHFVKPLQFKLLYDLIESRISK